VAESQGGLAADERGSRFHELASNERTATPAERGPSALVSARARSRELRLGNSRSSEA
jgi:hypothetical protein